jgi:pilus assembly protein CpaE
MKDVQRVAIVDPSEATREPLRNLLLGLDTVWLEAESPRYEFFLEVVQQSQPDLAIVALDSEPTKALQLIGQLAATMPQLAILAVSSRTDGQFILQTLRTGAREFLTQPLALEELLTAMQRVRSQRSSNPELNGHAGPQGSMVIAVAGSRGGIGSTTLGVNLGCALAQDPHNNVVLIDLDLALGDTDVSLDIMPSYTLADVAMNIDRLDMTFLRGSLCKHSTGLSLLPHPVQLDDVGLIQEEHLQRVLGLLRATYSHVILDLSKSYRPTDYAALKAADVVLLVGQLELPSIRNIVRLMMAFGNQEGLAEKVRVVLNRVGSDDQDITLKKAEDTIGRSIFWQIPNDSKTVLGARNAGQPLIQHAPRSKVCQSILGMAATLNGGQPVIQHAGPAKTEKKKSFLFF